MHDLLSRMEKLERERALLRLLNDYGRAIDYGDQPGWLDLFAEDAMLEIRYREGLVPPTYGGPDVSGASLVYVGHAQLATFIAAHSHAPASYHKHIITGTRLDVAGDGATAESYFLRVDERGGSPVIVASGRYIDRFSRSADARWRFAARLAEVEARLPPL